MLTTTLCSFRYRKDDVVSFSSLPRSTKLNPSEMIIFDTVVEQPISIISATPQDLSPELTNVLVLPTNFL